MLQTISIDVLLFRESELDTVTLRSLCKPDGNFLDFIIFYLIKLSIVFVCYVDGFLAAVFCDG